MEELVGGQEGEDGMLYERILNELDRHKIKYLVVGGLTVNLHGYDRITG